MSRPMKGKNKRVSTSVRIEQEKKDALIRIFGKFQRGIDIAIEAILFAHEVKDIKHGEKPICKKDSNGEEYEEE